MWLGLDYPVNFMFNNGEYSTLTSNNQNDNGYLYKEMAKDWILNGDYSKEQIKKLFLQEVDNYLNDIIFFHRILVFFTKILFKTGDRALYV